MALPTVEVLYHQKRHEDTSQNEMSKKLSHTLDKSYSIQFVKRRKYCFRCSLTFVLDKSSEGLILILRIMVFVKNWEDFEAAAESMYMASPDNCRFAMKYTHVKGHVMLKMTDNVKCIQFKAETMPELKKIEKFSATLMNHMASKEGE